MAKKNVRYLLQYKGTWYFRKKIDGRTIKRSLHTSNRAVARDLRDIYLDNLARYGQLDPPKDEDQGLTFGQVAKMWASIHKKSVRYSTWRDYVSAMNGHILPVFKDIPIKDITYLDVVRFRSQIDVGAKRANNILVPMKSVFELAHRQGFISHNVMKKVKRLPEEAPEIQPFTYPELLKVIEAMPAWYRPYTSVAFFTGMRAGEQNALEWRDYRTEMPGGPHIFVNKTFVCGIKGPPKTKKSKRYIVCLPQVIEAMETQRNLTGRRKHIFLTRDGRRMTPDHFRKEVWIPALEKAGFDYRPPRQTRHTFATMMISAGEELGWVQHMLGHSSLQMIFQKYYIWIPRQTRSDGTAFERFVSQSDENRSVEKDPAEDAIVDGVNPKPEKKCTKIVRLTDFRQKKGLRNVS